MPNGTEGIEEPEEQAPEEGESPPDLAGYGRRAFDIARKRFGSQRGGGLKKQVEKQASKAAEKAAGKAAGTAAGAAIGSSVPIVGTIIGAAVGAIASKLTEKFGPSSIKWAFYILLAIFLFSVIIAIAAWGILSGSNYFGGSPHVQAKQSTIDKFLAFSGDATSLRKLIIEKSDQLKQDLESEKKEIDSFNIDSNKKEEAKKKIDEALSLIDEVKLLLSGEGSTLSSAAKEKIDKLVTLLTEIRNTLNFAQFYGEFALPLGSLTCKASHNRTPHTLAQSGHGVFIIHNGDGGALDYTAPAGSPVYAITDGVITYTGWIPQWHNYYVKFKSEDGKYEAAYAHITKEVEAGDKVSKGQIIGHLLKGTMNTPHLHFDFWINGQPIKEKAQIPYFCGG